ncbi:DUF424 family protein [Candidatus Woesearchaeota archaeon]|jgi:uncharacterized protein|nr:DUF424 family protein [Candidatus Woesearchaeota archaeon]MBT4151149.1 DUF424 family protein [Candidatus Woesearchaeota archaeon]MBT4247631.1 DUF424 family protein [Candidatus Woesearchaeota archaeon]MBT4433894.1 DUF424 family protein [Candidatus Woesearchaeota archaeon]MBT7332644.1 DUF424 family protein [Candidatus Woesearchaeota archaeon]
MIVSQKQGPHGILLVVTDSDLIGKKFEEERVQLDLMQDFYKGDEMNKEEVKILLQRSRHAHFTGKESVAVGVELDLINPERILYVEGVPHAEVILE